MMIEATDTFSAFGEGGRLLLQGGELSRALAHARQHLHAGGEKAMVFADASGRMTEVDAAVTPDEAAERLQVEPERRTGPGRPKLGVVSREVSLLPRHWAWAAQQPGGASAAIRRLIDAARKAHAARDAARQARDATYKLMAMLGGDLPGFEEGTRALYASDFARLAALTGGWPEGLASQVAFLAGRAEALEAEAAAEAD